MNGSLPKNVLERLIHSEDSPVVEARGATGQEIAQAAAHLSAAGFVVRVLDGATLDAKSALLDAIAAAFQFPGYFGRNWDALIDCWSDMAWLPAPGYICIILRADVLERTHQDILDVLRNVAGFVAERWKREAPALKTTDEKVTFKLALVFDAQAQS